MASPTKLAHVVFETFELQAMRDWYLTVLEADVAFENDKLCFLRYDNEHHRLAIAARRGEPTQEKRGGASHVAFSYDDLATLIDTYERLKNAGILPYWVVNHGPTTSLYYRDPDRNGIELQVDNSKSEEDLHGWFASEAFAANPAGVEVDIEGLIRRYRAGEPVDVLLTRADVLADVD